MFCFCDPYPYNCCYVVERVVYCTAFVDCQLLWQLSYCFPQVLNYSRIFIMHVNSSFMFCFCDPIRVRIHIVAAMLSSVLYFILAS